MRQLFDTVHAHLGLPHVDCFCGSVLLPCMSDFPFGMISVRPENIVPSCLDVGLLAMNWFGSSDSILFAFILERDLEWIQKYDWWSSLQHWRCTTGVYAQALLLASLTYCAFDGSVFPLRCLPILFVFVSQKVRAMPCADVCSCPPCPWVQPASGHVLCFRFGVLIPGGRGLTLGLEFGIHSGSWIQSPVGTKGPWYFKVFLSNYPTWHS